MALYFRQPAIYDLVMSSSSSSSALFPTRLRTARELRGLSQGDLAERSGLQPSAVSHFETGARKPSFDNLRRLADALEVTTDYLLGRVDKIDAHVTADRLYRHIENLSLADREFAEKMLKALADKGHGPKKGES